MRVFKAALQVLFRNPAYLLIYAVAFGFIGVAMASAFSVGDTSEYERAEVQWAVIDRDDSGISHGIEDFLATQGTQEEVADDELSMQDAVAKGTVDYMLVIPQGYGEQFLNAVRAGDEPPKMDVVYSYYAAEGALVDAAVANYLGLLGSCAILDGNASEEALSQDALEAASKTVPVEVVETSTSLNEADTYAFYLQFCSYGIFAAVIACVGMLISILSRSDMRRRILSSPVSYISYNLQTAFACLVLVVCIWAWFYLLGMSFFPSAVAATSTTGLVTEGVLLFAYVLVPTGVAFFIGQFGLGMGATNAIGNIGGLVISFLGGAWISLDLVPGAVAAFAHFLPGYWFTSSISAAAHVPEGAWDQALSALGGGGVLLLFALVFFLAGMVVARMRMQTSDAGGNALATSAV